MYDFINRMSICEPRIASTQNYKLFAVLQEGSVGFDKILKVSCILHLALRLCHLTNINNVAMLPHNEIVKDCNWPLYTLILLELVRNIVSLSMPMPHPPVGGNPYSSAVQKFSSTNIASSSPAALSCNYKFNSVTQ